MSKLHDAIDEFESLENLPEGQSFFEVLNRRAQLMRIIIEEARKTPSTGETIIINVFAGIGAVGLVVAFVQWIW